MEKFEEWLENIIEFEKGDFAVPKYNKGCGWGLFACQCIRPSTAIVRIPDKLIIRSTSVLAQSCYRNIASKFSSLLTSFDLLCLFLCHEQRLGDESYWAPYISMLPQDFVTPASLAFDGFKAKWLPPSSRTLFENQQREIEMIFTRLRQVWSILWPEESLGFDTCIWSWNMVNTRCVYFENDHPNPLLNNVDGDTIALIPYFDLLNHSPTTKNEASYCRAAKSYTLLANETILEGDEVFVCYGGHSNTRLLLEYGFTLTENPNNSMQICIEKLIKICKRLDIKLSSNHEHILRSCGFKCCIYEAQLEPSWNLMAVLKIISMSEGDLKNWQSIFKIGDFSDDLQVATYGKSLLSVLLTDIKKELKDVNFKQIPPSFSNTLELVWNDDMNLIEESLSQLNWQL